MEQYELEVDDVDEPPKQPKSTLNNSKELNTERGQMHKTEQNFFSRGYWIND